MHICVEISGQKSARFISLYPANKHKGLSRMLSIDTIYVQLIDRIRKIDEIFPLGQGPCGHGKEGQYDNTLQQEKCLVTEYQSRRHHRPYISCPESVPRIYHTRLSL